VAMPRLAEIKYLLWKHTSAMPADDKTAQTRGDHSGTMVEQFFGHCWPAGTTPNHRLTSTNDGRELHPMSLGGEAAVSIVFTSTRPCWAATGHGTTRGSTTRALRELVKRRPAIPNRAQVRLERGPAIGAHVFVTLSDIRSSVIPPRAQADCACASYASKLSVSSAVRSWRAFTAQ